MIPTRRSTGEAVRGVISHLLGDACSPYVLGLVFFTFQLSFPLIILFSFHFYSITIKLSFTYLLNYIIGNGFSNFETRSGLIEFKDGCTWLLNLCKDCQETESS